MDTSTWLIVQKLPTLVAYGNDSSFWAEYSADGPVVDQLVVVFAARI